MDRFERTIRAMFPRITVLSITVLSITVLSITVLSITVLSITAATFVPAIVIADEAASADNANRLTNDEQQAGFELLFDGSDLKNWKHAGNWKVEDGAIARADAGGDLTYDKSTVPDDFELRFEWKVATGSNSGVYYRPGQYEYQILDNAVHRDGRNPRTSAASLYFCIAPSHDATRPVGEWNTGRIVAKGSVIQHWLNGEKVLDFDYTDARWTEDVERLRVRGADLSARGGRLYLQDHGDPVWYRSIRLRTIPADEDIHHETVEPAAQK